MTGQPTSRRLLFLANDANFFFIHRLGLTQAAVKAGFDVHVALPFASESISNQADLDAVRAAGATLHDLPLRRAGVNVLQEIAVMARMWRLLARLQPDILYCLTIKPTLYGGALARLRRIPRVVFAITGLGHVFIAQGARARMIRWLVSIAYWFALNNRRCTAVFENKDDRELFVTRRIAPAALTALIHNGVDVKIFYPAPTPPPEPLVVLLPARLYKEKGVREFVEASRMLRARGISARMVLVGYADFNSPAGISEAEVREWCETDGVEWWGYSADMPNIMRQAHIVCLPSYREGFSKVLLEAGACGLPVVTTDVAGCRDAVRAGETALLVPAKDAAALAGALGLLLGDPSLRARMGAKGRELVVREYSAERFIAASMALYEQPRAAANSLSA